MSNDHSAERSAEADAKADADLQREIRAERKFTLAEAIGRLAGPGAMKGASPVGRKQQAEAVIGEYLCGHMPDAGGVLANVLLAQVRNSELLLKGLDRPLVVLAGCVQNLLASEYGLKELVRQADVEWGRLFDERPCFEKDGCAPAPGDPYTVESVRSALTQLAGKLAADET